jgi:CRISPR/Cas system CSM-associated protein Csm3 (group 7 of RAMP superfamily)
MARAIDERIIVTGRLEAESPLHIGGIGEDPDSDMPFTRDGQGRYFLPGSSLAGALRSWTWQRLGRAWSGRSGDTKAKENRTLLLHLWGYQPGAEDWLENPLEEGERRAQGDEGRAAALRLDDAPVMNDPTIEIRDGVGIDRTLGVAADQIKFDRAIVPQGTAFDFRMVLETHGKHAHDMGLVLALLLDDLESGCVRIGAATTRGLGRVRLDRPRIDKIDLTDRRQFCNALTQRLTGATAEDQTPGVKALKSEAEKQLCPAPLPPTIRITWQPVGPVMVKADAEGTAVDMLPLTTQVDGSPRLVIPGSSVKGALRAQAERIVRTVLEDKRLDDALVTNPGFLQQVEVDLVTELFGKAGDGETPARDKGWAAGRGALGVGDCVAETVFDADVLSGQTERTGSDSTTHSQLKPTMHVAIDRWTGGAAEHFLYGVLEPHGVQWPAIELTLDPVRLPEGKEVAALALLLLTLNDLALGRLTLGFAGNRGMGEVSVDTVEITGVKSILDPEPGADTIPETITLQGPDLLKGLKPGVLSVVKTGWTNWLKSARQTQKEPTE